MYTLLATTPESAKMTPATVVVCTAVLPLEAGFVSKYVTIATPTQTGTSISAHDLEIVLRYNAKLSSATTGVRRTRTTW